MSSDLFQRFQELRTYVGWDDDDDKNRVAAFGHLEHKLHAMVEDFYTTLRNTPSTAKVITGGEPQIKRLKASLHQWLTDLLLATRDERYVSHRWEVGRIHVTIGLDQVFVNAAMSRLRQQICLHLDAVPLPDDVRHRMQHSLLKALDLDLAIIEDAYQAEFIRRKLPANQARFQQQRVAAEVGRRALEINDLSDLLNFVTAVSADVLLCDQCVILELPASGSDLVVRAGYGIASDLVHVPLSPSSQLAASLRHQKLNFVRDTREANAMPCGEFGGTPPMLTSLASCILGERGAWGLVVIRSAQPVAYDEADRDFVESITNTISSAVRHFEAAARVRQQERLAGIGQMITGLAHESRNALQRIQACTEMLSFEVPPESEASRLTERIESAQDDLTRLLGEVRNYAAPLQLELKACELSSIWRQAWEELAHNRPVSATLTEEILVDDHLLCDRFQLRQVFRILFENSLAAGANGLWISLSEPSSPLQSPSSRIEIHVGDDGPGIAFEQAPRVFEPFFTTKAKGTGLGLSICKVIIEAHHGEIRLANFATETATGAEFVIELPRSLPNQSSSTDPREN